MTRDDTLPSGRAAHGPPPAKQQEGSVPDGGGDGSEPDRQSTGGEAKKFPAWLWLLGIGLLLVVFRAVRK